jgi:hypothetical protein
MTTYERAAVVDIFMANAKPHKLQIWGTPNLPKKLHQKQK